MLAPKSVALLVAGVIIITSLFGVFHVTYPTGNPIIPPIQPKQYQLFKYQYQDKNLLGNSTTSFSPTSNGTVTIEGYVYGANSSGKHPLGSSYLYAAVFPAETDYYTSNTGFFQITVVKYGHGTFAFQVPGFNPTTVKLSLLGGKYIWLNLTLHSAQKYKLSGNVVDQSGHSVPSAGLTMTDFIQTFSATSSATGNYSLTLYNGTYGIAASKSGYSITPKPSLVTISGKSKSNFTITLLPKTNPVFDVSGYITNVKGKPVNNAIVTSSTVSNYTTSNSSGYYKIKVAPALNVIAASAVGYGSNYTIQYVQGNLTDINLTLSSQNPFSSTGSGKTGSGLSGVPPGTIKNITGTLGNGTNGTSTINYGNNTTKTGGATLFLSGNITDIDNGAPVSDTAVYFFVNVNGTYFYYRSMTNGTGFYSIGLNHTGHYVFYVYSPLYENYSFSIWVNSSTYKNFKLTPRPGYNFNVQGQIREAANGTGIPGNVTVYLYNTQTAVLLRNSNSNGYFSFNLVQGNYSFKATSYGFSPAYNSTSSHPLVTDVYENFSLVKASTIGSGTTKVSGSGSTGIPGLSSGNVTSQLGNSSGGSTVPTGQGLFLVTVHLVNNTSKAALANMQFELFIKFDSVDYQGNYSTDSNGNAVLALSYKGNYTFLPESVYYYGVAKSFNVQGNMTITLGMYAKPTYSMSVLLVNSYNYTRGSGTYAVSTSTLDITNYKQVLYSTSTTQVTGVGTYFNYTVPDGNYSFSYLNPNYVNHAPFYINISGASGSVSEQIAPYLVVINSISVSGYAYTLSPKVTTSTSVPSGTTTIYQGAVASTLYSFSASVSGNILESNSFSLSAPDPVMILNLTIGSGSTNAAEGNTVANQTPPYLNVSYNYKVQTSGFVYSMFTSYTMGSNPSLIVGGFNEVGRFSQKNTSAGTYLNFSTFWKQTGGTNLMVYTVSTYGSTSYWDTQFGNAVKSTMTVSYYTAVLTLAKNTGGQ